MGVTVAITFPLGRYHATRWDGGANTSDVEWPPSPWRLLRALIAVWYARWPDLPAAELDALLAALGTPAAYRTPAIRPGTTRHYMPDVHHARANTGNTDQVIDAWLAVDPNEALEIHWDRDLTEQQRATLGKLLELMPYLGRSESICTASLLSTSEAPDTTWWRLGESGDGVERIEVLAPDGPAQRALLEATTVVTRKARRLIPVGARRVSYGRTTPRVADRIEFSRQRPAKPVECLLFQLSAQVPLRARNAVLATDALHGLVAKALSRGGLEPAGAELLGKDVAERPSRGNHDHLHVVPVLSTVGPAQANDSIRSILLWRRTPIPDELAARIMTDARRLWVREDLQDGMTPQQLLFAGAGSVAELAPMISGEHRDWISAMPYLPVRHRKFNQDDTDFLRVDVGFECRYRNLPEPVEATRIEGAHLTGQIAQFRRRRLTEHIPRQRRGVYLRLSFAEPVAGPLLLGQLSHFGFGLFVASSTP